MQEVCWGTTCEEDQDGASGELDLRRVPWGGEGNRSHTGGDTEVCMEEVKLTIYKLKYIVYI